MLWSEPSVWWLPWVFSWWFLCVAVVVGAGWLLRTWRTSSAVPPRPDREDDGRRSGGGSEA